MTNTGSQPEATRQIKPRQVRCPVCHGGGIANYVTREMAFDAGDIRMTGAEIRCTVCDGDGWIYD